VPVASEPTVRSATGRPVRRPASAQRYVLVSVYCASSRPSTKRSSVAPPPSARPPAFNSPCAVIPTVRSQSRSYRLRGACDTAGVCASPNRTLRGRFVAAARANSGPRLAVGTAFASVATAALRPTGVAARFSASQSSPRQIRATNDTQAIVRKDGTRPQTWTPQTWTTAIGESMARSSNAGKRHGMRPCNSRSL
jgi:hypothetical protein